MTKESSKVYCNSCNSCNYEASMEVTTMQKFNKILVYAG